MRSICRDSLLPRLNSGGPAGSIGKLFCWAVLLTVAKIVKIRKMDQGFYPAITWSTVGNRRPNVLFPARQSHGLRRGLGTRMRPLTERLPKPLVAVAGKPLIDHTLDRFAAAGVDTAIVNVHYLAGQIEAHLAARKIPKILISDERETLLDQGGGIAKVLPWLGQEPFFSRQHGCFLGRRPSGQSSLSRGLLGSGEDGILLLVAAVAASVGVDHQVISTWRPMAD